jgi:hypothetical protein
MKNNDGSRISSFIRSDVLFIFVLGLLVATQLFALGTLSYLGTFSRHLADDYCESAVLKSEPVLSAVLGRYMSGGSNRFSNLLFVGLAEKLGENNLQIFPFVMILLWVVGTIWVVRQFRQLMGIHWPALMDVLMAVSIVFFSAWQAPNRYQTFLWRSGMATHFAPLVFTFLFFGFILSRANSGKKPSLWASLFVFLSAFLIGGFSEPPAAFLVVMLSMLILVVWQWDDAEKKPSALTLLVPGLAGVMMSLAIMIFSPTMSTLANPSILDSIVSTARAFPFTINFMDDTFRTKPAPSLVSFLTSFLIFFVFYFRSENQPLDSRCRRQIWLALVLVPLVQYLLVAASFAPSAYGESYPAERAQIIGRVVMTTTLLVEGALLGILCASYSASFARREWLFLLGGLTLLLLAFYPLRAGLSMLAEVPDYRERTTIWDRRESEIYDSVAAGERDLVVRYLPTREGIKELDATTKHWVNQCAAQYYGVDSIRSVPMGE